MEVEFRKKGILVFDLLAAVTGAVVDLLASLGGRKLFGDRTLIPEVAESGGFCAGINVSPQSRTLLRKYIAGICAGGDANAADAFVFVVVVGSEDVVTDLADHLTAVCADLVTSVVFVHAGNILLVRKLRVVFVLALLAYQDKAQPAADVDILALIPFLFGRHSELPAAAIVPLIFERRLGAHELTIGFSTGTFLL